MLKLLVLQLFWQLPALACLKLRLHLRPQRHQQPSQSQTIVYPYCPPNLGKVY